MAGLALRVYSRWWSERVAYLHRSVQRYSIAYTLGYRLVAQALQNAHKFGCNNDWRQSLDVSRSTAETEFWPRFAIIHQLKHGLPFGVQI